MKPTEQILVLLVLVLSLSNLYFIYVFKMQTTKDIVVAENKEYVIIYRDLNPDNDDTVDLSEVGLGTE